MDFHVVWTCSCASLRSAYATVAKAYAGQTCFRKRPCMIRQKNNKHKQVGILVWLQWFLQLSSFSPIHKHSLRFLRQQIRALSRNKLSELNFIFLDVLSPKNPMPEQISVLQVAIQSTCPTYLMEEIMHRWRFEDEHLCSSFTVFMS